MNFSANIIEEWLLTGKAVLKNLSCGNAGLVQIPVPEGKTYIITKIEILPFANVIYDDNADVAEGTFSESQEQILGGLNERSQYQLLFWNERINNSWNFRNTFAVNAGLSNIGTKITSPSNIYTKHEIDCFMVVESNSFLFLKYIDFKGINPSVTQTQLNNVFNINWPPSPFWGYSDQYDLINWDNIVGPAFNYVPQGYSTSFATPPENFSDNFVLPAVDLASGGNPQNTFIPPLPLGPGETGGPVSVNWLQSIPLYNIQYIEVNRRLSTTGLL